MAKIYAAAKVLTHQKRTTEAVYHFETLQRPSAAAKKDKSDIRREKGQKPIKRRGIAIITFCLFIELIVNTNRRNDIKAYDFRMVICK